MDWGEVLALVLQWGFCLHVLKAAGRGFFSSLFLIAWKPSLNSDCKAFLMLIFLLNKIQVILSRVKINSAVCFSSSSLRNALWFIQVSSCAAGYATSLLLCYWRSYCQAKEGKTRSNEFVFYTQSLKMTCSSHLPFPCILYGGCWLAWALWISRWVGWGLIPQLVPMSGGNGSG